MPSAEIESREGQLIETAIVRLRSRVMATVFALVGGTGVFLATAWLLVRGGPSVGLHLNLLSNYFPGYSVTWLGSLIGFVYGCIVGGVVGWSLAWIYNRVTDIRHPD